MIIGQKKRTLFLCILFMISMLFISSCDEYELIKYRTWIDFPQQGNQFYLDEVVPITAHYYAEEDANYVVISINDLTVMEMPPEPPGATAKINHDWAPGQAGKYKIGISILNENNDLLSKAEVEVFVFEEPETATGIFLENGFCRFGPGTAYPAIAIFEAGHQITLEARSEELSPLWWYVYDQSTELFCWVSGIVIGTDIAPESLLAMEAPTVPEPVTSDGSGQDVCNKDMNQEQCIAAGGTWYAPLERVVSPFCICPE